VRLSRPTFAIVTLALAAMAAAAADPLPVGKTTSLGPVEIRLRSVDVLPKGALGSAHPSIAAEVTLLNRSSRAAFSPAFRLYCEGMKPGAGWLGDVAAEKVKSLKAHRRSQHTFTVELLDECPNAEFQFKAVGKKAPRAAYSVADSVGAVPQ
jgi:hypothetical protein